jgi:hypothetical protein
MDGFDVSLRSQKSQWSNTWILPDKLKKILRRISAAVSASLNCAVSNLVNQIT